MEQLHFITKLLGIKDPNIQFMDIINRDTHKEIIAKLDYDAPSCPDCGSKIKKYDFQKPSKISYLETTGMPTRILLRKRRFKCYHCSKWWSLRPHSSRKLPNSSYHQPKDCSKVDWKDFYDRHCSSAGHFNFNCYSQAQWLSLWAWFFSSSEDYDLGRWNSQGSDCFNREMKMSFIAQDFDNLNIITVLEGKTQVIIRNHFLKYDRVVRCQVKIITMDMFSPYYGLAKQLRFRISRLRLKQSPRLFHSHVLKSF